MKQRKRYQYWPIVPIWRGWKDRYRHAPLGWHGWVSKYGRGVGWVLHLWIAGVRFGK